MDRYQAKWNEEAAGAIIKNLEKRHLEGSYAPTAAQATREILDLIPDGAVVSRGGSMTVIKMGLWKAVEGSPRLKVIDPFPKGISREESIEIRREAMLCDVFLTSTNAITQDGRLVNLDATGNRVAALIFGPRKVFVVAGMNKVCPDLESAMARVKHRAAPINCMRLSYETPCAKTGLCSDCRSPGRICYLWSIIEGHSIEGRIHVKLIGEELGY